MATQYPSTTNNSKFEKYEILKPFLQRHIVEKVLKTNPPVFVAIDPFACTRGMNTYGLSQKEGLQKEKDRIQLVRNRSIESIKSAWEQIPLDMQKQVLLCWRIDWSRESETTDKFHRNPAAVVEIVPKDGNSGTATMETEAVIEVNDPFAEQEEDGDVTGLLISTFESFPELLERQNPACRWWNDYTIPLDEYERSDILDDFPLELVVRSQIMREYAQVVHKVKRAFKAALDMYNPQERSAVYSVLSAFWKPGKWGEQDPSPNALVVLVPNTDDDVALYWDWIPGPKVIEMTEDIVLQRPEHELVSTFHSIQFELINFPRLYEKPVPWLTGKALKLAQLGSNS